MMVYLLPKSPTFRPQGPADNMQTTRGPAVFVNFRTHLNTSTLQGIKALKQANTHWPLTAQ